MSTVIRNHQRALSFLLALCLLVSCLPMLSTPAEAVYHTDYAAAATAEQLASTQNTFTATPAGGMLRIIDGDLYVWGSNSGFGLGLGSYNGEKTTGSTVVTEPVKHDYAFEGKIVKVQASTANSATALTDTGAIYVWGSNANTWLIRHIPGGTTETDGGRLPFKLDTSRVTGGKIVDIDGSGIAIAAKDEAGNWYYTGTPEPSHTVIHIVNHTAAEAATLMPVPSTFVDKLQDSYDADYTPVAGETEAYKVRNIAEREGGANRRTIKRIVPVFHYANTMFVTSDDKLYTMGTNIPGTILMPDNANNTSGGSATTLIDVAAQEWNQEIVAANPDWYNTLITTGTDSSAIDAAGNVWAWGSYGRGDYFYQQGVNSRKAQKVYDATMNGAKAVKVFLANRVMIILTEDNALYALGQNTNQFITTSEVAGTVIRNYQQVAADISAAQTVVGVYPTDKGVTIVTQSGEQYYTGDNSLGTAGNGSTESAAPGVVEEAKPSTIPPVKPATKNEISIDIVSGNTRFYTQYNKTTRATSYVKEVTDDKGKVTTTTLTAAQFMQNPFQLKAGSDFFMNVYFEDFGKLTGFTVPLRFNPKYVKVVNNAGTPYAEGRVVTPGAIGEAVGIVKEFTNEQWDGGILIGEGGSDGTYPKICNSDGWVSVSGYTMNTKAKIVGKVKMFSVRFTVVAGSGDTPVPFGIATDQDVLGDWGVPSLNGSSGYDTTSMGTNFGAAWKVTPEGTADMIGHFDFAYGSPNDPFPNFTTRVIALSSYSPSVSRSDGTLLSGTDSIPLEDDTYQGHKISNANSTEVYTVRLGYLPEDASFPQADWTLALVAPNAVGDQVTAENYISVVERGGTYLKFKVVDNLDSQAVVRINATSKKSGEGGKQKTASVDILLASMDPPSNIQITEKAMLTNETMIYTSANDDSENKRFTVTFPEEGPGFSNTAVNWKLMDKDRNELPSNDLTNHVYISGTTPGSGNIDASYYTPPSVTVAPNHTTFNDDYVILRAESLYDPSIADEIKLKVHFKATDLQFKQASIRIPTDETKDLTTLLQIGPENDYYETNLVWEYIPFNGTNGPDYLIFNDSSIITAGSMPTPKVNDEGYSGGVDAYETVKVTDSISGLSASIKIYVLHLSSPIKPNQVEVFNLLGDMGDYIKVSGLLEGDIITFYQTYDTIGAADTPGYDANKIRKFGPLTAAQAGTYNFPVQKFLFSEGGEIAMTVTRKPDPSSLAEEYDRIPVSYDAEPSKVYGYVSLAGKSASSARLEGIAVQLSGLSSPDVVYTDKNGYFEFKTYIIPGNYTLTITQDNYLRRVIKPDAASGYVGLTIPSAAEFAISTKDNPISLYPGDLNGDGGINATDINQYVRNWVGRDGLRTDVSHYDFYDSATAAITLDDLDLVTRHNGWVKENYPKWTAPSVS